MSVEEVTDVIVRPLLIFFERSWQLWKVPEDWKKTKVTPVFKKGKRKDCGNYRTGSLPLIPGKVMEQNLLETTSKQIEDKVTGRSQYGFINGKSCLTNLISLLR